MGNGSCRPENGPTLHISVFLGLQKRQSDFFWGGIKSKDQNLAPNVLDSLNNLKLRLNHCELKNKLAWLSRCDGNIASLDDKYRGSLFQDV